MSWQKFLAFRYLDIPRLIGGLSSHKISMRRKLLLLTIPLLTYATQVITFPLADLEYLVKSLPQKILQRYNKRADLVSCSNHAKVIQAISITGIITYFALPKCTQHENVSACFLGDSGEDLLVLIKKKKSLKRRKSFSWSFFYNTNDQNLNSHFRIDLNFVDFKKSFLVTVKRAN